MSTSPATTTSPRRPRPVRAPARWAITCPPTPGTMPTATCWPPGPGPARSRKRSTTGPAKWSRPTPARISTPTADLTYAEATTLQATDTVVEQTQNWYDADGNAIATADYQQFPGDAVTGRAYRRQLLCHRHGQFLRRGGPRHRGRQLRPRGLRPAPASRITSSTADGGVDRRRKRQLPWPPKVASTGPGRYLAEPFARLHRQRRPSTSTPSPPARSWTPSTMPASSPRPNPTCWAARSARSRTTIALPTATPAADSAAPETSCRNDTAQDVTTDDQYDSAGRLVTQTAYDNKGSHSQRGRSDEVPVYLASTGRFRPTRSIPTPPTYSRRTPRRSIGP